VLPRSPKSVGLPLSVPCGCFVAEPSYVHQSIKCRTVSPVKVFPSLALSKSHAGFMSSAPPRSSDNLVYSRTLLELRVILVSPATSPSGDPQISLPWRWKRREIVISRPKADETHWLLSAKASRLSIWLVSVYMLWGISTDLEEDVMENVGRQRLRIK